MDFVSIPDDLVDFTAFAKQYWQMHS